ncbi:uncharacterized protein I303_101381 [Kwoniella dejecticola CBS 10117]|uniref:D-xylose 1-dehydrogenase (NADP(+), D-xylono-1,5-lactone-forming) n=1 Tax=Kwoniella dejecticola CBS 10117 TaxID=1296121 RepID=A0A1A6AHL3_9TREE|nr:uncharacterized protein I303_01390 [Kwoniella dejecticola CBS 10117]OBR89562.1 hypothetical protein I303_01390 [Kwoniella dejecticola CBS 10117]
MAPYTLRWGIISTGWICTQFTQDLLVDPKSRSVSDVSHKVAAVGSRSVESAQIFINKLKSAKDDDGWSWGVNNGLLDDTKPLGTYDEVYNDSDVDAIYVGTPNTMHHQCAKAALLAGKHVLCEKPFCLNSAELEELISIARSKNLFLMEVVWVRFHPIAYALEEVLRAGQLGKPQRFFGDLSFDNKMDTQDPSSRLLNPSLGGGSLLDLGPYPALWAMLLLHRHPLNQDKNPKLLFSHQTVYERTGVDLNTRWCLEWKGLCQGLLSTDLASFGLKTGSIVLQCEHGDLLIDYPPYRAESFEIHPKPDLASDKEGVQKASRHHHPIAPGNYGMSYEADEVARCIRDGRQQSDRMPWEESLLVQGWFDQIIRDGNTKLKDLRGTEGQ